MKKRRVITLAKGLLLGITFAAGLFGITTRSLAVCINYDTAMEAVYTECYSKIVMDPVQGSPLEAEAADGVDTSTGKLTLLREDLELEGMAGMDLNLTRYYDSKKANIGKAIAQEKKNFAMDTVRVSFTSGNNETHEIVVNTAIYKNHADALKDMFVSYKKQGDGKNTTEKETQQTKLLQSSNYNAYGISTGWAFDFPWIETMTFGSNPTEHPLYLHYGSAGSMRIATDENNKITGFQNYDYQDIKLEDFNRTVDGVSCRYLLRNKMGLRTYFNKDGVVVMQKDNHDNTIRFTYRNKIYFDTITDTVGRKVEFDYTESAHGLLLLDKITVEGKKVAEGNATFGGVSKKTIRYKSSETSYTSIRGGKMYGSKLNSATVDGTKESYTYKTVESFANTCGAGVASQRAVTNETYLIQGAEEDGCIRRYEYRAGAVRSKSINNKQERDVVTQHYYVTREYEQSAKNAGKKANGLKYDYFQKQTDSKNKTTLVSYDDLNDEKHEMQAYGTKKLQCMTLVSTYNPNKKAKDKKFTDYTFAKKDINTSTLQLKKKPKRSTMIYVYNTNRLLLQVTTEEKKRAQTEYTYDKGGAGSLMLYKVFRNYGTKRTGAGTSSTEGLTYDIYRNVVTEKFPKAYQKKYEGKEYLFSTTYTYYDSGYPKEDKPYVLNQKSSAETYRDKNTKSKEEYFLSSNQIDMGKMNEYISENNGAYRLLNVREITYDKNGNTTMTKYYPDYSTEGRGNVIENRNQYNEEGQLTKKEITRSSEKHPEQNESYVQQETVCDSFGNVMSVKDQKGLTSIYTYDEDKDEITSSVSAKGTAYETEELSAHTEDNSKTMSLDLYNRCTVTISDDFGNTIISKDEKGGTWTENDYVYDDNADDEDDSAVGSQLVEERTYAFEPTEEKVITNDKGEKEYNYDINGRGNKVLSGTRHIYDEDNEEIVTAEFSGGAMDANHCYSWTMIKTEEEINDDGSATTTYWEKELNPKNYQQDVDKSIYYNQFDEYVLSETVTETITDEDGNEISEITTETINGSKKVNETISVYDEFGNVISQTETVQVTEKGKAKNKSETITSYKYDYHGNITEREEKSRKDANQPWEITTTKTVYDDYGHIIASYSPKGMVEGYATKYEYDISGQLIKEMIPVEKKDNTIIYQINTIEYDTEGNIIAEESEQGNDVVQRTEYTYDIMEQLVQVKDIQDEKSAIYVQYMYDREGNKIRQFTGLTKPLTLSLKEGKGNNGYTYMGHDYYIEISGKAKKDSYSETKYCYNKKDELTAYVDPEGNEERYTYDVYGNLIKVVDKNGNKITQHYDYQNRIVSEQAEENETKAQTSHTYEYDDYGNTSRIDNCEFTYDAIYGEILTETMKGSGQNIIRKSYQYDSDGDTTKFGVEVNNKTKLGFDYEYDGEAKLKKVKQTDGEEDITVASYEYDADDALIKEDGQKVNTDYGYHLDGTVSRMTNHCESGVLLSQYNADYLKNGQKEKETEEVWGTGGVIEKKTSQYTYDRLGRLVKESHTGEEDISYTYDAHNNRKEMISGKQVVSYKYNKNDELLRTDTLNKKTEKDSVTLYKRDKNGNQLATVNRNKIEITKEGPQFNLNVTLGDNRLNENVVNHYDAWNQNTETLTEASKVKYTYDAGGLRTSKTVNGKKTNYVWDGDKLVMELDAKGNVKRRYIWGQNLIYTDEGDKTDKQFYTFDMHGSVIQLIDENGSIKKRYTYDAFGNEKKPDKKDENPFRYCGEYYDTETGTLYLKARNYDSETGRFLTADTYTGEEKDISSLNLYTYCNNDSVNMVDPTGHWGQHKEKGKTVFTHRFMTKNTYPPTLNQIGTFLLIPVNMLPTVNIQLSPHIRDWQRKKVLDGTLLPDFVRSGEQESYQSVYGKKTKGRYKEYESYEKELIFGYPLIMPKKKPKKYVNDNTISDIFHGKSYKETDILKNEAKVKYVMADKSEEDGKKKSLFLGCVLHSIQDLSAHSYFGDLQAFKDAQGKGVTQKERAFHKDWNTYFKSIKKIKEDNLKGKRKYTAEKEARGLQEKIHSEIKDNPYSQFVQNKKGTWYWKKKNGKRKNERYKDACKKTKVYLQEIIWQFK